MASRIISLFRNIYTLLTKDLTWDDLKKSLNEDVYGMYVFYAKSMQSVEGGQNKAKRAIKFLWYLFIAFLLKLTPARRFIYTVALVFILVSLTQGKIALAFYSFAIINILLAMELADKLITKDELSVARDIQLSLQPTSSMTIPGYEIAAHSEVATQVGGDYYDLITLSDGSLLVVIGDVSGKGLSSALYVVKIQTALQLFASETSDPKELLVRLNSHLYGQLKRNYFLSLFLVRLKPEGKIELCRAGHPPALLYESAKKITSWLKPNGIAVGMAPSTNGTTISNTDRSANFECSLETLSIQLDRDDVLFLFTDGVSESVNAEGREFGQERIDGLIKSYAGEPVNKFRDSILNDLQRHRDGADLRDDTTFVLLKRV